MKLTARFIQAILMLTVILAGCRGKPDQPPEQEMQRAQSVRAPGAKKVVLIVADSLMSPSIDEGIREGRLPSFRYLIDRGKYYKDFVSSFPTMSVTIDSTIVTGAYPDRHRVPGLAWYSEAERRVVNYGTGPMEAARTGASRVLLDLLSGLNGKHLNPKLGTIYENLADRGLRSGSVNGLIYRGRTDHALRLPASVRVPLGLPKELKAKGPDLFAFGSLSDPMAGLENLPDGPFNKAGFNNEYAIRTAERLIESDALPDFLYVYLPDLDQKLHKKGPSDMEGVVELDEQIGRLLRAFGSPEEALKQAAIIVTGDSGMSRILPDDQRPVVDLPELLGEYDVLRPGASVTDGTQLVLAVNETMAYVHALPAGPSLGELANRFRRESRIGIVAWREAGDWVTVRRNGIEGELRFKRTGKWTDPYGQSWTWKGNPEVLDLEVDGNRIRFGEYPDAMQRLFSALSSHSGTYLVATSAPGYELAAHSSPTHAGGGGHGSLHRAESLVPVIVCGTNVLPERHRLVDLKSYILGLFPVTEPRAADSSGRAAR